MANKYDFFYKNFRPTIIKTCINHNFSDEKFVAFISVIYVSNILKTLAIPYCLQENMKFIYDTNVTRCGFEPHPTMKMAVQALMISLVRMDSSKSNT